MPDKCYINNVYYYHTNINVLVLCSLQVYGSLSGHEHGHITGHGRK